MYEKYYQRLSKLSDIQLKETPKFQETAKQRVGIFTRQTDAMRSGYKSAINQAQDGIQVASADETDADMWAARSMAAIRQAMLENPEPMDEGDVSASITSPLEYASIENMDMEGIKFAARATESTHDYSARGPVVEDGMYKGQRALGAYQVMPGNLASWSKQALGREVSEKEFLETPEIQDAIFEDQIMRSVAKYGTVQDAMSVWFTGSPVAEAGNVSDGHLTAPEYLARFEGFYTDYQRNRTVR